jgi:hypothetical protein
VLHAVRASGDATAIPNRATASFLVIAYSFPMQPRCVKRIEARCF